MKKTITILTLIFALLLTAGCAASNVEQNALEAMHLESNEVLPAADPAEEVVDEQTQAPTEKATEAPTEKATEKPTEVIKTVIGKDKAKSIALEHAGLSADKVTGLKAELDKDDSKYEVEFRYNNYEYDYDIDAYSGKVLKNDKEYDGPTEAPPKATEKATEKATKATEAAKKEVIGKDKAKSIALKHAGLSADDVTGLKVELDEDDGVQVYEVEFDHGRKEYSYEINAKTGKIRSYEIDD